MKFNRLATLALGLVLLAPLPSFSADTDLDGVDDSVDNCVADANSDQRDTNGDGFGNLCDPDLDNDGIVDQADIDLFTEDYLEAGPGFDADFNGDELVNFADFSILAGFSTKPPGPSPAIFLDADSDGIADYLDNCVSGANSDQRDTNGDGIGNLCDPDLDNDLDVDQADTDLFMEDYLAAGPGFDADFNGDERVNFADFSILAGFIASPPGPSAGRVLSAWDFSERIDAFVDESGQSLTPLHHDSNIVLSAGGLGAGDIDGDGDVDLYMVGGEENFPDRLFENVETQGTHEFREITAASGLRALLDAIGIPHTTGALIADIDGQNGPDILVGNFRETSQLPDTDFLRVFRRKADGTYEDAGNLFNFTGPIHSIWSTALGDYDRDGDLDAVVSTWGTDWEDAKHLWRNDLQGSATFTYVGDETTGVDANLQAAGVGTSNTFTPNFADVDEDGYPDILMAADFRSSAVLLNRPGGQGQRVFEWAVNPVSDEGTGVCPDREAGIDIEIPSTNGRCPLSDDYGMGAAVRDFDRDGHMDWFVTSIAEYGHSDGDGMRLFKGLGAPGSTAGGWFLDATESSGVHAADEPFLDNPHIHPQPGSPPPNWGWGACFEDFDNNGFPDIFHVNGFILTLGTPSRLLISNGDPSGPVFRESAAAKGIDHGEVGPAEGRGVSCFDYDRDGDVDVFVSNDNGPLELFENTMDRSQGDRNYLGVRLKDTRPGSRNTQVIGAQIHLTTWSKPSEGEAPVAATQVQEIRAGNNFTSQSPPRLHFGLGGLVSVAEVRVIWPPVEVAGALQYPADTVLQYVPANQELVLEHP